MRWRLNVYHNAAHHAQTYASCAETDQTVIELSDDELRHRLELEKLSIEVEKARVEKEKSTLEAARLRAPWYLRPEILQPIAAIAIASIAALLGFANGFFQTKLESLKNEQENVRRDLRDLTDTRSALSSEVAKMKNDRDELYGKLLATNQTIEQLTTQKKHASEKLDKFRLNAATVQKRLELQEQQTKDAIILGSTTGYNGRVLIRVLDDKTHEALEHVAFFHKSKNPHVLGTFLEEVYSNGLYSIPIPTDGAVEIQRGYYFEKDVELHPSTDPIEVLLHHMPDELIR